MSNIQSSKLFTLYGANTSNNYKILLMLKLLNVDYEFKSVDIFSKFEQFNEEFIKISPNSKVPVLVDNSISPAFPIFESGAILVYLAEKFNKYLPGIDQAVQRSIVLQWTTWQVACLGPFFGQYFHFKYFTKEPIQHGIERYTKEIIRLYNVLDQQLKRQFESGSNYVAGKTLSIADMAIFGWSLYLTLNVIEGWEVKFPNVKKWIEYLNSNYPVFKEVFDFAIKSYIDNVINKQQ